MNTEGTVMEPKEDGFVSLEQASKLIGVPQHILRRALVDHHITSLEPIRTGGQHRRFDLSNLLSNHEEILAEVSATAPKAPYWHSEQYTEALEQAAELREVIRTTEDADSVAHRLGVSRPTLRRWEREGKIVGVRPLSSKKIRYHRESVKSLEAAGRLA